MFNSAILFHLLIAFGAFQAFFIALILLTNGKPNLPRKFFSLFLLIEGITLVERLLVETDLIVTVPHLLGISYPISFIKPPILFLTALAIVDHNFKLRKVHLLHFIPFGLLLLLNIPFYLQDASSKLAFVADFMDFVPTYQSFEFYLFFSFYLNIGAYVALSIKALNKYRLHVKNNKLANWYLNVMWIYSTTLIIGFIYFVIQPSGILEIPFFNIVSMLTMTFLIQSIAYSFLTRSSVFTSRSVPVVNNISKQVEDEKLIRNKLEVEKLFLNDELTLTDFAQSLEMSPKYVSYLINQRFGNTFKDLVNHYRIEEAKTMIYEQAHNKVSLIEIAFDSGFNNKVSFYRTFKKHTGLSPSAFLAQLKEVPFKQTTTH